MINPSIIKNLFIALPEISNYHAPDKKIYCLLKMIARQEIEKLFSDQNENERDFEPFGNIAFPYFKMGAIDSLNLFDIDELIILSFYQINRKRYKRVLDIGANIGLHSIILEKCGFEVRSFEPDPTHYERLRKNIELNRCKKIEAYNAAVSSKSGEMEFTRVLGNTTGSHLTGSKKNPYGDLEKFQVKVEAVANHLEWADLVKLDAEGHEKEILLSTDKDQWLKTDAIVEIENQENAEAVYRHFNKLGVNLFSQKINWNLVKSVDDVPKSYKEGSLFITNKEYMAWNPE